VITYFYNTGEKREAATVDSATGTIDAVNVSESGKLRMLGKART